jgi:hypothetical protein
MMVVALAPSGDQVAGIPQVGDQMRVKTFVLQPTVEAFDETVLRQFAEGDFLPFDPQVPPGGLTSVRRRTVPLAETTVLV